jgi:hypothetical protein
MIQREVLRGPKQQAAIGCPDGMGVELDICVLRQILGYSAVADDALNQPVQTPTFQRV